MTKGKTMKNEPVILLVDDDDDFLYQQQLYLGNAGYKVITAGGRREAESLASTTDIDCAVIDLMMEEQDGGFVLAHHLKRLYEELPIIMVTSVTGETGIIFNNTGGNDSKWIEADVVLSKPIRFEQLEREIKRLIR